MLKKSIVVDISTKKKDIGIDIQITKSPQAHYSGPYEVIPQAYEEQHLLTKDKIMDNNVKVKEIPIQLVHGVESGYTVIIG